MLHITSASPHLISSTFPSRFRQTRKREERGSAYIKKKRSFRKYPRRPTNGEGKERGKKQKRREDGESEEGEREREAEAEAEVFTGVSWLEPADPTLRLWPRSS